MTPDMNIIDMRYCTEYQYLSDKATDFHFTISFGAWVVYKQKVKPGFFKSLFGELSRTVIIQEKKLALSFGLKQVRWYDLILKQRASIEHEVFLNKIKQQIIDKAHFTQAALIRKKGVVQPGEGKGFPLKKVDIILEYHP
jgi:hypothetical protein